MNLAQSTLNVVKFKAVGALNKYLVEVRSELYKVTWPSKDQVGRLTLVVLLISAIVASYIGGLDYLFTRVIEYILQQG